MVLRIAEVLAGLRLTDLAADVILLSPVRWLIIRSSYLMQWLDSFSDSG
jgi:hypothetical protein